MRRHPFDALSFVFGIAFVACAGALSLEGLDIDMPGLRWLAAGLLLVVGVVMLLGSRTETGDRP